MNEKVETIKSFISQNGIRGVYDLHYIEGILLDSKRDDGDNILLGSIMLNNSLGDHLHGCCTDGLIIDLETSVSSDSDWDLIERDLNRDLKWKSSTNHWKID